jgi:hypothetical protein
VSAQKSFVEALQVLNAKVGMVVGWLGERTPSQPPTICGWVSELADTGAVTQALATRAHELASAASIASTKAKQLASTGAGHLAELSGKMAEAAGEAALKVMDEAFPPYLVEELARILVGDESEKIPSLEERLSKLELALAKAGGTEAPVDTGALSLLLDRLEKVEHRVDTVQGQKEQSPLSVGTVTLNNVDQAITTVEEWGLAPFAYLFISPQILLEAAYHIHMKNSADPMKSMNDERKLGITDPYHAAAAVANRVQLPSVFGDGEEAHTLSKVKAYDKFYAGTHLSGGLYQRLKQAVEEAKARLFVVIDSKVKGNLDARSMLRESLLESALFLGAMLDFMKMFYENYTTATGMSSEAGWELVQFLVCAIWKDLGAHKAREVAVSAEVLSKEDAGALLWSSFQILTEVRDYNAVGPGQWEGHPTLSPAINQFLLLRVAMRPQLDSLDAYVKAEVARLTKQLARTQSAADKKNSA